MANFIEIFLDKVYDKYIADATLAAAANLCFDAAPDGIAYPYVTYHFVSGDVTAIFSGAMERVTVQFSIWSESDTRDEALDIADKLCSIFDHCSLSFTEGYTTRQFERSGWRMVREDKVWHVSVDYDIEVVAA